MKNLTTALAILLCLNSNAQSIDTVITTTAYTSYFNYDLHEPLYVSYKLYHGGGDCSRKGDRFTTDGLAQSATATDYKWGGYDKGHLANSKDFAYDCDLQKSTFHFYNCVPQTPALNRGSFKSLETIVREKSQTDSLLIITGSIFGNEKIGIHQIAIPDKCFKIVWSLATKNILFCRVFNNNEKGDFIDMELSDLLSLLSYKLDKTWLEFTK